MATLPSTQVPLSSSPRGKHVGKTGVIEKITEGLATIKGDDVFETEKANLFALGEKKSQIKIE
jgi:ribosomal protein S4E